MRHGDIGQGLVAAGIQRANDQRQAAQGFRHGPVGFELLVLIGRIGPVLEQEFGSQQPDRFAAGLDRSAGFGHGADIGRDLDPVAIDRDGGAVRPLPAPRPGGSRLLP